ncbi:MAG: hypothetical protein K0R54_714 [Clostridiaceae bacterium]|jgi:hypothetical protein|nr:hypothetical protein [Clostridiaceae bacterium]
MKNIFNEDIYELPITEFFKEIKYLKLHRISKSFWIKKKSKEHSVKIIKALYEDILNWSDEEIINNTKFSLFNKYGLEEMIKYVYNNSLYEAINTAYPGRFKIWEVSVVPKNYWILENGIEATKWLMEEKLNWFNSNEKIKPTVSIFVKYKLGGMLQLLFDSSPYQAINTAYPKMFEPWELGNVPLKYWTMENGINSTKWLLEVKLDWFSNKNIEIKKETFEKYGLVGMLDKLFKGSTYDCLNTAYPNLFKPWELCSVPKKYWTKGNAINATKWLIECKLKWSNEEVILKLRKQTFMNNGLSGMLAKVYNYSPYEAINTAYPGRFNKNDFNTKH